MLFIWSDSQKIVLPISLIVVILTSLLIFWLLKNKSEKIKNLPFVLIAIFLLIMEVIKQILAFPDYNYWNIPLHFCSTFMVWFSLASFAKGKLSEVGYTLSFIFGMWFLALFYIDPTSIIGSSTDGIFKDFSNFHTFTYHHLILLFMLLSVLFKKFNPKLEQIKYIVLFYSIFATLAITFAHLLDVNFVSLLYNSLAFMQAINDKFGIVAYTTAMYFIGLFGCLIWFYLSYLIKLNKDKRKNTI